MERFDVVIVGGGHGGAQSAIALRQLGYGGSIAIVSEEADSPYERPPLSKEYLTGDKPFERMLIRPLPFWSERAIALRLGTRVVAVQPDDHVVECADGGSVGYGNLIWAAGGRPHRLRCDGGDGDHVHVIRSRADVDRLTASIRSARRIAIVGGGYIGLEAAAGLRKLGLEVTLVEAAARVLSRVAGEPLSLFFEAEHRARGVDLRTGATVEAIDADGLSLVGGERVRADAVIVAIGIGAAVEPLLAAGASGGDGDGVDVDRFCRTSLPDIFAVGDCATHENRFAGGARVRLESVQNAHDQAVTAARAIAGTPEPYDAIPWFWSNQYDLKLQTVGLFRGYDDFVLRGEPSARSFTIVYLKGGRVVALDCVNAVRDYAQGRRLVQDGAAPDPARIADPGIPLKNLLPAIADTPGDGRGTENPRERGKA